MENCGVELNPEDLQKTIQTIQQDLSKYNKVCMSMSIITLLLTRNFYRTVSVLKIFITYLKLI